ncbi:phosphate starvation protein PhoH [Hyphomonas pacifica]|uniref:PhoH-like protein n=1 Tax=Hyphomonas pacifica TaxID=1280941 RepID=A0A062TZ64_9PROT|nr:PhoH family protein [Hyphomonas pacifica]KCZ46158.1 phosphate starvation protein PhoH [Hyphomonas pacifica]RAN31445.1 phosphate starvation protein PhoH [Hyphomonas pacifica]RAN35760.1 phosphate starvation protein PhoH [Hyphomonas pacifica]
MSVKRRSSASPEAPISRIYEVRNAETLRDLCGPHHRHLQLLETRLKEFGLRAESQGGGVLLVGMAEGVSIAEAVLAELERRLRTGMDITDMDVDGALEAAQTPAQSFGTFRGLKKPVTPQTRGQSRYIDLLAHPDNAMIFGVGPAGTGKTFLAVAAGVSELLTGARQRLIVTRPAVEAGEKLGFLPGTLEEKVDPYMLPIWDSLRELMGQEQMERRMARGEIEVAPLAFMRGRTLKNAFVIVDEAQNTTIPQMKMVLTRLGRDSRMVITGDPGQVDLPGHQPSGMKHALQILADIEGVNVHTLTAADVVRHGLVSRIIDAYAAAGEG